MVEPIGVAPAWEGVKGTDPALSQPSRLRAGYRSDWKVDGGADRGRTDDLLNAIQALSQLSYGPTNGED